MGGAFHELASFSLTSFLVRLHPNFIQSAAFADSLLTHKKAFQVLELERLISFVIIIFTQYFIDLSCKVSRGDTNKI